MTGSNDAKAPQDKVCGYEYTVRRGDSFYLIAHRLGVPLRDLLEANSTINPARLMVGDVLCIPMEEDDRVQESVPQTPIAPEIVPPDEAPSVPQTPIAPEIVPPEETTDDDLPEDDEDSLDQPAPPNTVMDEAIFVCPEADRRTISAGETISDIQLDAGLNLHTLKVANPNTDLDTLTAGQVLCVPAENLACPVPTTYTLAQNDTLERVALRYNVSVGALLRANPCLAPFDFLPGAVIVLPDGAHTS